MPYTNDVCNKYLILSILDKVNQRLTCDICTLEGCDNSLFSKIMFLLDYIDIYELTQQKIQKVFKSAMYLIYNQRCDMDNYLFEVVKGYVKEIVTWLNILMNNTEYDREQYLLKIEVDYDTIYNLVTNPTTETEVVFF